MFVWIRMIFSGQLDQAAKTIEALNKVQIEYETNFYKPFLTAKL